MSHLFPESAAQRQWAPVRSMAGFTLLELLVVMAVIGILTGIAAMNVGRLRQPADESARALSSTLKASRARAIASTSAVRVQRFANARTYTVSTASGCAAPKTDWKLLPGRSYELPGDVKINQPATEWTACFSSRGILGTADALPTVTFTDTRARSRTLTVYAGGALEVK